MAIEHDEASARWITPNRLADGAQSRPAASAAPARIHAFVSDEPRDYTTFFRREFAAVLRTVELMLRDHARAEEIAQDAFVQLHLHWSKVAAYERPDAWVRRVAIRLALRSLSTGTAPRSTRSPPPRRAPPT